MDTFTLTEEQLLKIIEMARGGANFIDYSNELPFGGIDFDFEPQEIITELKRGNIN